jgi:hypothetical protein
MSQRSSAPYSASDPRNPERIADNLQRYEGILRDHRPDSSPQLRAAFMESMQGREYGACETLSAFDWFWDGWASSSGVNANRSADVELDLRKAESQRDDFCRQLTAEREGRMAAERIVDEVRARNRELERNKSMRGTTR